nr:hypothetical protein GCM10025732_57940 [Glycomyces mayteni]
MGADEEGALARGDEDEGFLEAGDGRALRDREARGGPLRGLERAAVGGEVAVGGDEGDRGEVVHGDPGPLGERVVGGDGEHAALGEQGGALREVVLADGELHEQDVVVAVAQLRERVGEGHLADLDGEFGVGGAEGVDRVQGDLAGEGRGEADAEGPAEAAGGGRGAGEGLLDGAVVGFDVVAEARAEVGEDDRAAGALEQGAPTRRSRRWTSWETRARESRIRAAVRPKCSSSARIRKHSSSSRSTGSSIGKPD